MTREPKIYPKSKVEIRGFTARFYDRLMDLVTLGGYGRFIRRAIALMEIGEHDVVLDLGCGTGRNACLMASYLGEGGSLLGLDISEEMGRQFRKRCAKFPNVRWEKRRVDVPLELASAFDRVLISFVLHGFPHETRHVVLDSVFEALKPGGTLYLLDYRPFDLAKAPFHIRTGFRLIECPYAFDFIEKDWNAIFTEHGLEPHVAGLFFGGYVQLLAGTKPASSPA